MERILDKLRATPKYPIARILLAVFCYITAVVIVLLNPLIFAGIYILCWKANREVKGDWYIDMYGNERSTF